MDLIKNKIKKVVPASIRKKLAATRYLKNIRNNYNFSEFLTLYRGAGLEDDFPYIELNTGVRLYSYLPTGVQADVYKKLPHEFRSKIPDYAFAAACDVMGRYLKRHMEPKGSLCSGHNVIEGGAYIGHWAVKAALTVGKTGRVVAVEAMPDNFAILRQNVEANNLANVECLNLAITKESRTLEFDKDGRQHNSYINGVAGSGTSKKEKIQGKSLDEIMSLCDLDRVDFCRLMINGAELDGLTGGIRMLEGFPILAVAIPYNDIRQAVVELLSKHGYKLEFLKNSVFAFPETSKQDPNCFIKL